MIRLVVLLISFLKLLLYGRWYPPAHVQDVSSRQFADLCQSVGNIEARLYEVEKVAESTRKKVYRDDVKGKVEEEIQTVVGNASPIGKPVDVVVPVAADNRLAKLQAGDVVVPVAADNRLAGLQAGDEVPAEIL